MGAGQIKLTKTSGGKEIKRRGDKREKYLRLFPRQPVTWMSYEVPWRGAKASTMHNRIIHRDGQTKRNTDDHRGCKWIIKGDNDEKTKSGFGCDKNIFHICSVLDQNTLMWAERCRGSPSERPNCVFALCTVLYKCVESVFALNKCTALGSCCVALVCMEVCALFPCLASFLRAGTHGPHRRLAGLHHRLAPFLSFLLAASSLTPPLFF